MTYTAKANHLFEGQINNTIIDDEPTYHATCAILDQIENFTSREIHFEDDFIDMLQRELYMLLDVEYHGNVEDFIADLIVSAENDDLSDLKLYLDWDPGNSDWLDTINDELADGLYSFI